MSRLRTIEPSTDPPPSGGPPRMRRAEADRDALAIVFDRLHDEFRGSVDDAYLREVAREEVDGFDGARVRDFVPMIAWRQARSRVVRHLRAKGVVDLDARRRSRAS